jgi:hypothetical protein
LIPVGAVITPLPIPIGLLLIALGLTLLAYDSKIVRHWIRLLRQRFPGFSDRLRKMEPRSGSLVGQVLKKTDPFRKKSKAE